jgi:tetraacyldisaccharide 4'-kinase
LTKLEEKLQLINPSMIIARSIHSPTCTKSTEADQISLNELKGKKILAFCGLGNPDAFFTTIKALGANLISSRVYDDHHQYTENCLADICREGKKMKADLLLTTQKDWFSSPLPAIDDAGSEQPPAKYGIPFAYLAIELKFLSGEDKITNLIKEALAGKIAKK